MNYNIFLIILLSSNIHHIFGDYIKEIYRKNNGNFTGVLMRDDGSEVLFGLRKVLCAIAKDPIKMTDWIGRLLSHADRISGLDENIDYWHNKPVVINVNSRFIAFKIYSFLVTLPTNSMHEFIQYNVWRGYEHYNQSQDYEQL